MGGVRKRPIYKIVIADSRAARDGRNPQTGATIKIPAKKVVKFKAGAELSSTVNN